MKNFINALLEVEKQIEENKNIIGASYSAADERMTVLIRSVDEFIEIVEGQGILPVKIAVEDVTNNITSLTHEIWVEIDGILFRTYLTEKEYEDIYLPWVNEEPEIDDEEFIVTDSQLPENVRLMKEVGHTFKDFE